MKLKNKIAIVTGGSQGIGEAISYAYAKEGATVIVVNKNVPENGIKVANNIIKNSGRAEAIACDVADQKSVKKLVNYLIKKYGQIDVLVNNAAVAVFKNFEDQTVDDWNFVIDTNLKGPFLMSQAVVPIMKQQRHGKIIFVSSIAASIGFATLAPYSATKGGLLAMAKSMVAELGPYNINVNLLSPGSTDTPQNKPFLTNPAFIKMLQQRTASGHAMHTDDMAGAAVFLASDDSRPVHGLDLIVDNGQSAAYDFQIIN